MTVIIILSSCCSLTYNILQYYWSKAWFRRMSHRWCLWCTVHSNRSIIMIHSMFVAAAPVMNFLTVVGNFFKWTVFVIFDAWSWSRGGTAYSRNQKVLDPGSRMRDQDENGRRKMLLYLSHQESRSWISCTPGTVISVRYGLVSYLLI